MARSALLRHWRSYWALGALVTLSACTSPQRPAPSALPLQPTIMTSEQRVTPVAPSSIVAAPTATPTPAAAATPALVGGWTEAAAMLDQRVPALMEQFNVPGVALALISEGETVWAQGYGLADVEAKRPVDADTVFQAASISKSVTAWGVLTLVAAGKLDLDAPVERYLTRWKLPESRFDPRGVTVRRLLSHTAGLSLHGYPGIVPGQPLPTLEESLSGGHPGVGPVELVSAPGTAWNYSGGGYTLLQLIVEEVTGEPFADYMRRAVLEPLGMRQSSFVWEERLMEATAVAYGRDGQPRPNVLFIEQAPAGLYSTANDLGLFAAAGLPDPDGAPVGRGVLPPELVNLMYTPAAGTKDDSYGLGYQMNVFGPGLVGHAGANQGWKTFFGVLPQHAEGIVVLTNSDNGRDLRAALVEELYTRAATGAARP